MIVHGIVFLSTCDKNYFAYAPPGVYKKTISQTKILATEFLIFDFKLTGLTMDIWKLNIHGQDAESVEWMMITSVHFGEEEHKIFNKE